MVTTLTASWFAPALAAGLLTAAPTPTELAAGELSYAELLNGGHRYEGSRSVGATTRGRLVEGVELPPEGPHHEVLRGCRSRATSWATAELVALVEEVARVVAEEAPGPKLAVCNLSQEGGGRFEWSKSHQAGRDVDLAFFLRSTSEREEPVHSPGLVPMRHDGYSFEQPPRYAFDFPRNWVLVRALAMQDAAPVQWIFVREGLKRRLLRHARAIGEPEAVVARVGLVMKEPSDADRHDDHFHVRLFCTAEDRAGGCLDVEPRWPWFSPDPRPLAAKAFALALGVRDPDPAVRSQVLEALLDLGALDAAPALAELAIYEPEYASRARAASMLIEWNGAVGKRPYVVHGWTAPQPRTHRERACDELVVAAIEAYVRQPGGGVSLDDPGFSVAWGALPEVAGHAVGVWQIGEGRARESVHIVRAYKLLAKLATPSAAGFVGRALRSERVIGAADRPEDAVLEARLAVGVALHVMSAGLVPTLLDALGHPDVKVRTRVDLALRRITNHTQAGAVWRDRASPDQLARQAEWWRDWWGEHAHIARDELLRQGFRRRGQRFVTLDDAENIPRLVRLTKRNDELGYNADRLLVRITGRHTPRAATPGEKHRKWSAWYP